MRSPARLVTGTAAAALTAAALGLTAAPSAHADVTGLGRPELTAVALPAPGAAECGPGTGSADGAAECADGTTADDPAAVEDLAPAGELDEAGDPAAADPLDETGDQTALSGSLWPETDEAPDAGTGTAKEPTARPEPPLPPGHAEPPTGRPTTPPATRPGEPSGHVRTGVGGSAAPDTAQLAAGGGLVAAAAVAGALLLRRRRTDRAHH